MRRKSLMLACGVALSLLGNGLAQAENLLEVYQTAVKNDPVIREAEARRLAALEAKPQARGLLFPQLNLNGQFAYQSQNAQAVFPQAISAGPPPVIANVNVSQTTDSDFWQYQAQLTQTVFRWDQWQALKKADAQVALAEANYRAAEQDLMLRVSQRYFDVLAAEDSLEASQGTLEAVTHQLEQAEKRFEVGLIAITDVQESRAAHDTATADVIAAKRIFATANEALREVTGESYKTLIKPTEKLPFDQPQPLDEQAWVDRALQQNLNVVAARLGVEVASRNVKIAEAGHMPTLDLFANYAQSDVNATQTNNGLIGPADSNSRQDTIGIKVTIPVFSGGVTQSNVRQQVYLQRAEKERLEGAMRQAERQTRDAYLGVIAEKARVQALQQSVKSNQTALEATEAGFEVGTRTTVDVLNSRRNLLQTQRDYARTRYDYLINIVTLKSAAGELLPQDLGNINAYLTQENTLPVVRPKQP